MTLTRNVWYASLLAKLSDRLDDESSFSIFPCYLLELNRLELKCGCRRDLVILYVLGVEIGPRETFLVIITMLELEGQQGNGADPYRNICFTETMFRDNSAVLFTPFTSTFRLTKELWDLAVSSVPGHLQSITKAPGGLKKRCPIQRSIWWFQTWLSAFNHSQDWSYLFSAICAVHWTLIWQGIFTSLSMS